MRKSWLVCVLLGALAWGQAPPGTTPPAKSSPTPGPAQAGTPQTPTPAPDAAAAVPPDAPVLTIKGVCPPQTQTGAPKTDAAKTGAAKAASSTAKTPAADCKTVITKAEFERLASSVAPSLTPQLKRQLASVLPRVVAMSNAAEKKGLDKQPRFKETMKFYRMQILANELQRDIQDDAAKVPDKEIAGYYEKNPEAYEQFNFDRIFVPRSKQVEAEEKEENEKNEKLTEEQQKAKQEEEKSKQEQGEQEMTQLAESLHTRAAAGEDFLKLQKEAFAAAGMKIDSPTVNLPSVRRTGLPPAHALVFDLKPGEISQVINDSGGHYFYKVNSKEELPLDKVKNEIHTALQNQRTRDAMDKVQNSFQVSSNEAYFGAAGAGTSPVPPRAPNPRMAPPPSAPAMPQGQPPAQPPAPKPN